MMASFKGKHREEAGPLRQRLQCEAQGANSQSLL